MTAEMEALRARIMSHVKAQVNTVLGFDDYQEERVRMYNAIVGNLTGFDCSICRNKGLVDSLENGTVITHECVCMESRRSLKRIEESGLGEQLVSCTFEAYIDDTPWRKAIKQAAMQFAGDADRQWFYIGGQVGCGKTHICVAIVGELLRQGYPARYMMWRDESTRLKAIITDDEAYGREIGKLKRVKVLYIDDFFKADSGRGPTPADVNLAFEILNYRYNDPGLITLISSEKSIDELLSIDEAVGSRIHQRSKKYALNISKGREKNYRLRAER